MAVILYSEDEVAVYARRKRIRKALRIALRSMMILALLVGLAAMIITAYTLGEISGALDPLRSYEVPMCVVGETDIRTDPIGYVIGTVPAGGLVWFVKLEIPFAHVSFYDGQEWLDGTVTATALDICR